MTDFDKIKAKLKKLFALSRSPNANEAALALEMAQKLMSEYGIERNAIGEFDIIKEEIKGNSGKKPPLYEAHLMSEIAKSFGLSLAYGKVKIRPKQFFDYGYGYDFIGLEHRVKIAAYIASVLLRKLKKARAEYMKSLIRVRILKNKIKRADDFCSGWVYTVISKLAKFTNAPEEQTAIDNYVGSLNWKDGLETISRKSSAGVNDWFNGRRAGSNVQIQNGVEGRESGARLLASQLEGSL